MRFQTSDPDIATIMRRIERNTVDLQPEFQRGEVWSTAKKQRLIDTILRRWHVPPIHLVAKGGGKFDVLDGQQRLTAIRDFVQGDFSVDGSIEPEETDIVALNGLRYARLPEAVRDEFDTFAIRIFELHDYTPDEPHELFFRLNQPITLTEAEKRNAFIGAPRNQIKDLVVWAEAAGMTLDRIGFSNARMSYDELIARFLLTVEQKTLLEKVTASRITARYRSKEPFPKAVISLARTALQFFLELEIIDAPDARRKPNKATIHTWLCMTAKLIGDHVLDELGLQLATTISIIEKARFGRLLSTDTRTDLALSIFNDRATARVADAASVVLRDLCAWMILVQLPELDSSVSRIPFLKNAAKAWEVLDNSDKADRRLVSFATSHSWGGVDWF